MTSIPPEIYAPDGRLENDVVAELAREAVEPVKVEDGLYLLHTGKTVDLRDELEKHRENPDRKKGTYAVTDVTAFVEYLAKHGEDHTELWANDKAGTIRAVINAHTSNEEPWAGWEDHTVTLRLPFSKDWTEWVAADGQRMPQATFAEFIEDHLPNFVTPSGADMLELAQTFQATSTVDFESSQRLKSGETSLAYVETTNAKAGTKGALTIPDTFELALQVHERGPVYRVQARFRYRINGGNLTLAYRLTRIDDVRRHAFDEVAAVVGATGRQVWNTP
ncbi:YfdQ family protein [Phycicoccus sp. KQZ13P-1]|uniref:DUF2303 family protein n=1 Tax=Phycicoccus mangrovi TaxID=2840470 RepID=UPI001C003FBE|nr:DUF2303 family protein [Phycicoccus mangrovi]MBT9255400.1 YfdQ family protein [Phycicoccus mangrovi]